MEDGVAYLYTTGIVFTKSEVAEFQRSGKLPPTSNDGDLTEFLDLTELKALLSNAPAEPSAPAETSGKMAAPTASTVYLNGVSKDFEAYNIDGNNYFKLRDLMQAVDVFVGYDDATKNITLDTSKGYVEP